MAFLLHHLLSDAAARQPEREAVRCEQSALTYGELDRLTNQLARSLRAAGVQRGDRVGICMHKSLGSVISVFGILKTGAVCVPLDPNSPPSRISFITRNCETRALLVASDTAGLVAEAQKPGTPSPVVIVDPSGQLPEATGLQSVIAWERVCRESADAPPPTGGTDTDLAYILYTSGSTGDPKGVMISHRAILTFVNWCREIFAVCPSDRVTSHAPLHFDLSTFDIYATIQGGGTVVLVPEKLSVIPMRLVQLLQDEGITVTYLVPSILSMMVNYGQLEQHDLSRLRLVLFAGEVFPMKYLSRLVAAVPRPDYYNLYGPTETNVCTYYRVTPQDLAEDRPVPIGRACANTEVFAVDIEGRRISRPGEEGELWVRGSGVASGYWGDKEKTSRNFVRNTHNPHFEEVAYRTGDIVVLEPDRVNWRYIGRRDHMIKSRGYRIELGEIEAVLYTHTGVKEAAVIGVPDELVGNRLKAFVVPIDGDSLTVKELRTYCSARLPGYMVPESIQFRSELPKTSTGKVNRPLLAGADG